MIYKFITILILVLFLGSFYSCIEKTNFTEEDLQWIVPYKEGDTLIFQEVNSLNTDTIFIVKKEISYGHYNPISSTKIMNEAHIWYKNRDIEISSNGQMKETELISMYKNSNNKVAEPFISYLGYFDYINENKKKNTANISLILTDINFEEVYVFSEKNNPTYRKDKDCYILYWDKDYGIIKYETYNGEVWERINWN